MGSFKNYIRSFEPVERPLSKEELKAAISSLDQILNQTVFRERKVRIYGLLVTLRYYFRMIPSELTQHSYLWKPEVTPGSIIYIRGLISGSDIRNPDDVSRKIEDLVALELSKIRPGIFQN